MRRRPSVLPLAVLVLLVGSGGAAAQEPVAPAADVVPAPTATAAPVAEPAAPSPEPEVAVVPTAPEPSTAPAPPPEPQPAAPQPQPAAAVAPPTSPAVRAAPAASPTAKRFAVRSRVRRRPGRAPNQEQADGRIVLLDGHVTIGAVPPATCVLGDPCVVADYEVSDLEVRSEPDGPALITVTRARARGPGDARRIDADVTLRPPGGEAQQGQLELDPGDDLLDPATYRGTSLEAAIAEVLDALRPLTGEGGSLEGLTITFGAGFVKEEGVAAVGVSTQTEGFVVFAPLEGRTATEPAARPVGDSPDAGTDPEGETAEGLVVRFGVVRGVEVGAEESGGGGPATAVSNFATSVFGALVTGACQAVGDQEDCDKPAKLPPFVVDVLTVTLFVLDDGRGIVEVRCPDGYKGVSGTLSVFSEIRLGEVSRRLAADVRFTCDEPVEEVRIRLLPDELRRLDDQETLPARLTVIAVTDKGQRDSDVNEHVSIRLRSRSRRSG